MNEAAQILVRRNVNLKAFREEIIPAGQPVVLKDLVSDWPAVKAGRESPRALADFLRRFDGGKPVVVIDCASASGGHLFYSADMSGLNFGRSIAGIGATLDRLLAQGDSLDAPRIFMESMRSEIYLPDFPAAHPLPLLDSLIAPRIWIGNNIKVQTHFDLMYNIACVVGGRRRFTLFPPEQVANLYLGPIDFTPSGAPISMVPLHNPDLARFPRFAEAWRHAQQAELMPGDGLYIPYAWWHHVESLTPFNVLANYWWNDTANLGSPFGALLHGALSLRDMPADQREVWRALFEHFVFTDPEVALAHLPPDKRGLLGPRSAQRTKTVRNVLAQAFTRP